IKKLSHTKRIHDDQDLEDRKREKSKKRRQRGAGESSSKKRKDQDEHPHFERGNDVEEPRQDDQQVHEGHEVQNNEIPSKHNSVWFQKSVEEHPVQSWFNKLVDPEEEPKDHEYKDGPVTYFGKLVKKIFKKYKIIKKILDLTDKIDWINPKGERFHQDLSKPLPLTRPP
ncbi:hypothetical protein Tco_0220834, partial [Tanacetum coccineum]